MGFKSLLISIFAVLLLACPALAEPKYKKLQTEAKTAQAALRDAETTRTLAANRVTANVRSQKKAAGAELAALKKVGVSLARDASKAAKAANKAQTTLANKQGEVRAAAANFAVIEVSNEKHKLSDRIREVIFATDAWAAAIGDLPSIPKTRDTSKIADPEEKMAVKADDRKVLKTFIDWADAEIIRLDFELTQMGKVLLVEAKVKNQDDGTKMITEAKALKKKLSGRKTSVKSLRSKAKSRHKALG